jgi:adenosylmethionine-8-amino-7-oxononanoate aminotransferase
MTRYDTAYHLHLDIVANEDLPGNASRVGAYMQDKLQELMAYAHVGEVRGKGMMAAIEMVTDKASKTMLMPPSPYIQTLVSTARSEGAIIRVQGNRLILSPPLVFTPENVDEALRVLHLALTAAEKV